MTMTLRNTGASDLFVPEMGVNLQAGQTYTVPSALKPAWADAATAVTAISAGTIVVNDGTGDLDAVTGANYLQAKVVPRTGFMTPVCFSGLTVAVGSYLSIGSVASSAASLVIPGPFRVVALSVTNSGVLLTATTFQVMQRTAVSTYSAVSGLSVTIASSNYTNTATGLNVFFSATAELAVKVSAGVSVSSTVFTLWIAN